MNPLAVTGLGIVSPLGLGRVRFFEALALGEGAGAKAFTPNGSGASATTIETFDAEAYPGARVAEVHGFDVVPFLGEKGHRNMDRLTKLLVVATKLAFEDARIKKDGRFVAYGANDVGIASSTAYGSLEAMTEMNRVAELEHPRFLNPAKFPNTVINSAAGFASIWEDLRALNVTVSSGTPGALDAVLCSALHLGAGRAKAIAVGGAEALSEAIYLAYRRMGSLVEDRTRHIDKGGRGMRLGEAAALLVLELDEAARARGASMLGEIAGFGTAFEPPSSQALILHPSADATERAIRDALTDAGVDPGAPNAIDVVASSAVGIDDVDLVERTALDRVFGRPVPVAAIKDLTGETFGASGAVAMACALGWFAGAPPAPMLQGAPPARVDTVLVTSVGYYGSSTAVVLRRPRTATN